MSRSIRIDTEIPAPVGLEQRVARIEMMLQTLLSSASGSQLIVAAGGAFLAFNNTIGQNLAIPHGLGRSPVAAGVWAVDGTEFLTVQQSAFPDITNLYVSANVVGTRAVDWIAVG